MSVRVVNPPYAGQKLITIRLTPGVSSVENLYHTFTPLTETEQPSSGQSAVALMLFPSVMVPLVRNSADKQSLLSWFGPILSVIFRRNGPLSSSNVVTET